MTKKKVKKVSFGGNGRASPRSVTSDPDRDRLLNEVAKQLKKPNRKEERSMLDFLMKGVNAYFKKIQENPTDKTMFPFNYKDNSAQSIQNKKNMT